MKILMLTVGSRGDVQPFVALGRGLQAAGHSVTVCTCARFEALIRQQGLEYGYMSNDFLELMDSATGRNAMERGGTVWGWLKTTLPMAAQAKALYRCILSDAWNAAQAAQPDLVVFHPKVLAGAQIAEKLNVPVAIAVPLPAIASTAKFAAVGFPSWPLGSWYNKLTHALLQQSYRLYDDVVRDFRQNILNLPPQARKTGLTVDSSGRAIPVLHGYSPSVLPRPSDWPETAYVTGYWFLDRDEQWQPPPELQAFLAAGEAPVYIGFGSMAGRNPQRTAEIAIAALQQAGARGILATGWGGLEPTQLPSHIFKLDAAPHAWLFPKMAAVVHHGGAGTTAAGLRAGRPTIIFPFFGDQPFWGKIVYELGVGTKPIPQKELTSEKLAAAIREATSNPTIQQKATDLGAQIACEDGIGNAIAILEGLTRGRQENYEL
jgi:sterol 3beta-glucosyltransferase